MSINTADITNLVEIAIEETGATESLTGYQIAKIVNVGLLYFQVERDGKVDQIATQQVYNATKAMRALNGNSFSIEEAKTVAIRILSNRINGSKKVSDLADRIAARMTAQTEQVEA